MADILKRQYNVPLRSSFINTAKYKKTNKAVKSLKEFIAKHMKTEVVNVKLGQHVNHTMWARGDCKPPHHVLVDCEKDAENIVKVELAGKVFKESIRPDKKTEEPETLQDKIQDKLGSKKDKKKAKEESKEEKAEEKSKKPKEEKSEPKVEAKKEEPKEEAKKVSETKVSDDDQKSSISDKKTEDKKE